jgi:Tol biopolymer transport system component
MGLLNTWRRARLAAMSKSSVRWGLAVGCLVSIACPHSASAAFPGRNGLIAYTDPSCVERIATIRPDGTRRRLLTRSRCSGSGARFEAWAPAWAPGGRHLVFAWRQPSTDTAGLAVAEADGSHRAVVLANTPSPPGAPLGAGRDQPAFAPNGRRIAYERLVLEPSPTGLNHRSEIWMTSTRGSFDRRLGPGGLPRWSPDGRTIASVDRERGGTWLISARTGTRVRRLWRRTAESLDWAPDGRRLIAGSEGGGFGTVILRADGGGAHPLRLPPWLARQETVPREAVWSPDGRRIAFVRKRHRSDGTAETEIWTASPRGTRARLIWARAEGQDEELGVPTLSWQPLPE